MPLYTQPTRTVNSGKCEATIPTSRSILPTEIRHCCHAPARPVGTVRVARPFAGLLRHIASAIRLQVEKCYGPSPLTEIGEISDGEKENHSSATVCTSSLLGRILRRRFLQSAYSLLNAAWRTWAAQRFIRFIRGGQRSGGTRPARMSLITVLYSGCHSVQGSRLYTSSIPDEG